MITISYKNNMSKLDELKENIIAWYPFKENTNILYVKNQNEDEQKDYVEEYLKTTKNDITTINLPELKNVKKKYDYIIILEAFAYANTIFQEDKPYTKILQYVKQILQESGKVLFATDNRLGVKYMAGNKSEHCENIYDSINNKFVNGKMFNKSEVTNIIEESGFNYHKFYYPLPDYRYANVIYTDGQLPDKNDSKINYNVIYDEGSLILQDETRLLKQFIRQGDFAKYTNSYFVELSNDQIENNIKYVSYNNMRKDKYSLILKIEDDIVRKEIKSKASKQHLKTIKKNAEELKELGFILAEDDIQENENEITEKLIKLPLLDSHLTMLIKQNRNIEAIKIMHEWYNYIKERLNVDEKGNIKEGFIDLVFENTFYDELNNSFIFFDQEWYLENIPVKYLLYRAIQNLYNHNKSLNNTLPIKELKRNFAITEDEENEKFVNYENKLQEEVIDEEKKKCYAEQYKYIISSEEVKKCIDDLKRFDKDNAELINEVNRLKNENEEIKASIPIQTANLLQKEIDNLSFKKFLKGKLKK